MRRLIALFIIIGALVAAAWAALPLGGEFSSMDAIGKWLARIIALLPWANERDSVDKLTMGNMAKYTLASNAARDASLLAMLKQARNTQPKKIASVLNEVIDAAESVETTHLRKDALAAIEELKRKGPGSKRDWSTWGTIGQGALALGCIVAATTGHVEFGLPCMIGGAASGAAISVISSQ